MKYSSVLGPIRWSNIPSSTLILMTEMIVHFLEIATDKVIIMKASPSSSNSNTINLCTSPDVVQDHPISEDTDDLLDLFPPLDPSSSSVSQDSSNGGGGMLLSDASPARIVNEVEALFASRKINKKEKKEMLIPFGRMSNFEAFLPLHLCSQAKEVAHLIRATLNGANKNFNNAFCGMIF